MDEGMTVTLEQELLTDLTLELQDIDQNFKPNSLLSKIRSAIREVYNDRDYPNYYTEKQKNEDMYKHYDKIRARALYDYAQIGAYGESSHSENSTSRAWLDRVKYCGAVLRISRAD